MTADVLNELAAQSIRARGSRFIASTGVATDRFLSLANQILDRPRLYGVAPVDGYWRIGESTLVWMSKYVLSDVEDSSSFLMHLQGIYVVDTARGSGEGRRAISRLKDLAEEAGCGLTLFAKSFGFSRNDTVPYAMQSFDELWRASCEEEWPIVYPPDWDIENLRKFYLDCGFYNMCLYDSRVYQRPKEDDLPFESQFIFLPRSMESHLGKRIANRLNRGMCEYCNR